jgi:hypothetical protein
LKLLPVRAHAPPNAPASSDAISVGSAVTK